MPNIQIIDYRREYQPHYVSLNRGWIEQYFRIEPMDLAQLQSPEANVLDRGGAIFFLLEEGCVRGTCALIPHGDAFELARMAVDPAARGRGYGDRLLEHCVSWARSRRASRITLLSNTVLAPAIALYRKHGFRILRLGPHPDYERANIEMELPL